MMDKELATLLDATSFQVADLVGPAIVIEGAANHLLSRLPETDDHRWNVTQALGSIVAARKSLESAAESLLHIVAQDGADMLAVEVDGGTIVEKDDQPQCRSRYQPPGEDDSYLPMRCKQDAGHLDEHWSDDASWTDADAAKSFGAVSVQIGTFTGPDTAVLAQVREQMQGWSSVGGDGSMRRI